MSSWYLRLREDDLAPNVILVGDAARVAIFEQHLENARQVSRNREYLASTGAYKDMPVTVIATGIGAPSMAIAVEEIARLGAVRVARVGTTMGVEASMESLVLAMAACRFEGTGATYAPPEVPALADPALYAIFREVLARRDRPWHEGLVATCDGFYSQMAPPDGREFHDPKLSPRRLKAWGVLGLDMETSALYLIGRYLGLATVSLCATTVSAWDQALLEPESRQRVEHDLVETALAALHAAARS